MRLLKDVILEKLRISSKLRQNTLFHFEDKEYNLDLEIYLPFTLHVFVNGSEKLTEIIEIKEEIDLYGDKTWAFYEYDNEVETVWRVVTLNISGVKNLFINQIKRKNNKLMQPHISYAKGEYFGARGYCWIENDEITDIIKESQDEPTIYANIILLDQYEEKVLILHRANSETEWKGMWCFPGGHVDANDKDPKAAAIRELKEETGIELSWNEKYKLKEFDKIQHNNDNSICYYYITTLETNVDVRLSKEHTGYEWFNADSKKKDHKWVPDVFQIIQQIL